MLHMAFAMYPIIHNVFPDDEKPVFLSFTMLDDLKQKGINKIKQELNIDVFEMPLKDLFLLSKNIKTKYKIEDCTDLLISSAWLPDILKVADAWAVLLPILLPTIKKTSFIKT